MRNTTSYLAIQLHNLQQSNMLNHMSDDLQLPSDSGLSFYLRYRGLKIYSDMESIENTIKNNEPFLCSYQITSHITNKKQLFFIVKDTSNMQQKIKIVCNDQNGMHKCGQWYTQVSIQCEGTLKH